MRAAGGTVFEKSHRLPTGEKRPQAGALPYRIDKRGKVRILIIRTRRSKRWSIPKGGLVGALSMSENAAKEAFEEAGVRGDVTDASAGMYRRTKRTCYGKAVIEIWVYLLRVTEQRKRFPEKGQRETKWVSPRTAARLLQEPLLAELCLGLCPKALGRTASAPNRDGLSGARYDPARTALPAIADEFQVTAEKEDARGNGSHGHGAKYRLDFLHGGAIVGRDEFQAADDRSAQAIADGLFDAVSDVCQSFRLWNGGRFIYATEDVEAIRSKVQSIVIEREELIQSSRQAIASSHRLLQRLNKIGSRLSVR